MNTEAFATDANGKLLTCSQREFVAGNASRFCTRPQGHKPPCAFPVDATHAADQARIAMLEADADRAARTMERSNKLVEKLSAENAELRAKADRVANVEKAHFEVIRHSEALREHLRLAIDRCPCVAPDLCAGCAAAREVIAGKTLPPELACGLPCPSCGEEIP